jgi:hypothetical protein
MADAATDSAASLASLAEARLQRQNERIRQAEAALVSAPMERQRSDSNSKVKMSRNPNLSIDTSSRRSGSQEADTKLPAPPDRSVNNDSQSQTQVTELSRSLSTASRVTSLSKQDDHNDAAGPQPDDGFQVCLSRRSRRTLSVNNTNPVAAPPKAATVEGHLAPQEILAVFGTPLPIPSFLASNLGRSSGQLQFIQHPNGDVSAHIWSGSRTQWENVGQFSNIRKRIEGQLATCRLKGETASQMRRQNSLAYFRAVARQKEAELLGAPFGTADIKALLPEPVSEVEASRDVSQHTDSSDWKALMQRSSREDPFAQFVPSQTKGVFGDLRSVGSPTTTRNNALHAIKNFADSLHPSDARSDGPAIAHIGASSHNLAPLFLRTNSVPPLVSLNAQTSRTDNALQNSQNITGREKWFASDNLPQNEDFRTTPGFFNLGLAPAKPTISKSSPAAAFFESLKLDSLGNEASHPTPFNDEKKSEPQHKPSVIMPDAKVRGALRGQLIRLEESAKGRSGGVTSLTKITPTEKPTGSQDTPAKTPFRTVLHDPYRSNATTSWDPAAEVFGSSAGFSVHRRMASPGSGFMLPKTLGAHRPDLINTRDGPAVAGEHAVNFSPAFAPSTATAPPLDLTAKVVNVHGYRDATFGGQHLHFNPHGQETYTQLPTQGSGYRRALPARTFDLRGISFPEDDNPRGVNPVHGLSSIWRTQAASSASADHTGIPFARHQLASVPSLEAKSSFITHDSSAVRSYDDRLRSWWEGDQKFQRQEDFYQRIKAAHRISSPSSTKKPIKMSPTDTGSPLPNRPSDQQAKSPDAPVSFNEPLTRILIPVFENLEAYARPSAQAGADYWCPWKSTRPSNNHWTAASPFSPVDSPLQSYSTAPLPQQPATTPISYSAPLSPSSIHRVPEWAIDRGPKGNESFWDIHEWGKPPARVGRDSRYSSTSGGGGFSTGSTGSGRSYVPPSSLPSPVFVRGVSRLGNGR